MAAQVKTVPSKKLKLSQILLALLFWLIPTTVMYKLPLTATNEGELTQC
jgi:hypothetical protein